MKPFKSCKQVNEQRNFPCTCYNIDGENATCNYRNRSLWTGGWLMIVMVISVFQPVVS